jgi:hypothetical protein
MGYQPEFESVEAFVEFLCDDDRTSFTHGELAILNARLHVATRLLRRELEGYGLTLRGQLHEARIRTVQDNPHDRWFGPGSSPTYGGSGWEQIAGFAGPEG